MKVAVGIILNKSGEILITQRADHLPHGGQWEFPGGKLEQGETPEEALVREIKEEVDLNLLTYHFLGEIFHDYGSKVIQLFVFISERYTGVASSKEGQRDLRWVAIGELSHYSFPQANKKIINLLPQK